MKTKFYSLAIASAIIAVAVPSYAEEKMNTTTTSAYGDLRKREHVLSWDYSSGSIEIEPESGGSSKTTSGELTVEYAYNFGWWQIGGNVSSADSEDAANDETSLAIVGASFRGNFIENRPGNDLIPYGTVDFARIGGEIESGTSKMDVSGSGWELAVGLDWYPFGEIFALNLEAYSLKADVDYESGGTEIGADFDGGGLTVGYKIVF